MELRSSHEAVEMTYVTPSAWVRCLVGVPPQEFMM